MGLRQGSARFDSYSVSARLRRALTRTLAVYVEYLFYHYKFDEAADSPRRVCHRCSIATEARVASACGFL